MLTWLRPASIPSFPLLPNPTTLIPNSIVTLLLVPPSCQLPPHWHAWKFATTSLHPTVPPHTATSPHSFVPPRPRKRLSVVKSTHIPTDKGCWWLNRPVSLHRPASMLPHHIVTTPYSYHLIVSLHRHYSQLLLTHHIVTTLNSCRLVASLPCHFFLIQESSRPILEA